MYVCVVCSVSMLQRIFAYTTVKFIFYAFLYELWFWSILKINVYYIGLIKMYGYYAVKNVYEQYIVVIH